MLGKATKVPKAEKASKAPKVQLTKEEKALQKAANAAAKQAEKDAAKERAKEAKAAKPQKEKVVKEKNIKVKKVKEKTPKVPGEKFKLSDIPKKTKAFLMKIPGVCKLFEPKPATPITNDSVSFLNSIKVKLFMAFLVPITLFIITGILIYSKCSNTLIENSETSTYTTLSTLNEYFESGFEAVSLIATRLSVNDTVAAA